MSADYPLVSVIVPVYNVERFIRQCVASIVGQTYECLEIILVDDGSPDGCPDICDELARSDSRIRVVHKKNGGLSSARNAGMDIASGEYILFVDSDDYIDTDLVSLAIAQLRQDGSEICLFKHQIYYDESGILEPYREAAAFPSGGTSAGEDALRHLVHQEIHNYAFIRIAKTELYRRIGFRFPEGLLMEDLATSYLVYSEATQVSYLDKFLYYYRVRMGSIVSSWSAALTMGTIKGVFDLVRYVDACHPSIADDSRNYALKMLFYCWMHLPAGDVTVVDGEIKRDIDELFHAVGFKGISRTNLLKYMAFKAHCLRVLGKWLSK